MLLLFQLGLIALHTQHDIVNHYVPTAQGTKDLSWTTDGITTTKQPLPARMTVSDGRRTLILFLQR